MGNLVLLMPMGIFLPALFKSSRLKHCLIVLIGLILIEVLQLITGCGVFDIDDIILNYVGFFLVYCTMRAKFMEKIKEKLYIWI
jgi:glycopeptide antibiotics resistance protein